MSAIVLPFEQALRGFLQENISNNYTDNHKRHYTDGFLRVKYLDMIALEAFTVEKRLEKLKEIEPAVVSVIGAMTPLYNRLADSASRRALVEVAAFRLIGYRHVKLSYHESTNLHDRELLAAKTRMPDEKELAVFLQELREEWFAEDLALYNLRPAGKDLLLYSVAENIYMEMFKPTYQYTAGTTSITVEPGDLVLDCGAGLGDQALFFAEKAGREGLVVCLEPHPGNSKLVFRNMMLNPRLKKQLLLHRVGAWHEDNVDLSFSFDGCSSSVGGTPTAHGTTTIRCRTIDSLVSQLPRQDVSFIKMDIEGAETNALRGAEQTLRNCKPKLALSIYHSLEDFHAIPAYLDSLNLGYRYYLNHHAIDAADTLLYAVAEV